MQQECDIMDSTDLRLRVWILLCGESVVGIKEREIYMIKGKCEIEFGNGDVLITPIVKEDFSKGIIELQNKGTHAIGEYSKAEDFKKEDDDSILSFTKIESIDVLIERLQKLKSMMNGEISDCIHVNDEL